MIIHEGRFTYGDHGLEAPLDSGGLVGGGPRGLPIPLGCIAATAATWGPRAARELEDILAASVAHAQAEPRASQEFVLAHAQEMKQAVVSRHIGLYVNAFSRDLGDEGLAAVEELLARGREIGLLPEAAHGLLGG